MHRRLTSEANDFSDILLEDFRDTYLNLTLKTTFLLKWAAKSCATTKYVFKIDDDVFVNSERMWLLLGKDKPLREILCYRAGSGRIRLIFSL